MLASGMIRRACSLAAQRRQSVAWGVSPSRRGILQTAVAAAGGLFLAGSPAAADDADLADPATGPIDAHVHVWTPDTVRYPLAAGFHRDEMKPPSFTPEELFDHARPRGVARVVLIQMSFYGFDNSYMLDTIGRFPGVFSGVAVIDDNQADPAAEMRALAQRGVRGFRISPRNRQVDHWLDGPGMRAMWRRGAEDHLAMCHLVNPDALAAIDRACRKFPDTPVVIDHFARIGAAGRIGDAEVEALCKLAKHRRTYVKVSAFYALGKKQAPYLDLAPMLRKLLDAYGPERLMWASDCPFQVQQGHTYQDSIALVRDRLDFLSGGDKEWLLRKTAETVFFNEPLPG
ncbi:MAG TPA: amidohydrolase family protein [Pirellulales bacterium]|nr:amidohydrolase family protein [Pirellulales bacterium]